MAGFRTYRALAPGTWLFDPTYKDYATYREQYFREILAPLNPQKIWDDLHALADADTFYRLMWALQHFVNIKLRMVPEASSASEYAGHTMEDKLKVRKALFADKKLIEEFVRVNPQEFSGDDLTIVSGWRHFVSGRFFIERFLKKYAIFIRDEEVYGVLGVYEGLSEIIHPSCLPLCANAVLLPFKGRIIYDGIFEPYNVMFGKNIMSELKDTYMTAKNEKRIIETIPT